MFCEGRIAFKPGAWDDQQDWCTRTLAYTLASPPRPNNEENNEPGAPIERAGSDISDEAKKQRIDNVLVGITIPTPFAFVAFLDTS